MRTSFSKVICFVIKSDSDTNLYTSLLDADFPSASELSDKLDDLSLLAPFVDTAELVALDILAEDFDIPLDLGDLYVVAK